MFKIININRIAIVIYISKIEANKLNYYKKAEELFECIEQYPGIIGLRVKGLEGQWLMLECNRRGFAISTGSACQVGKHTLL